MGNKENKRRCKRPKCVRSVNFYRARWLAVKNKYVDCKFRLLQIQQQLESLRNPNFPHQQVTREMAIQSYEREVRDNETAGVLTSNMIDRWQWGMQLAERVREEFGQAELDLILEQAPVNDPVHDTLDQGNPAADNLDINDGDLSMHSLNNDYSNLINSYDESLFDRANLFNDGGSFTAINYDIPDEGAGGQNGQSDGVIMEGGVGIVDDNGGIGGQSDGVSLEGGVGIVDDNGGQSDGVSLEGGVGIVESGGGGVLHPSSTFPIGTGTTQTERGVGIVESGGGGVLHSSSTFPIGICTTQTERGVGIVESGVSKKKDRQELGSASTTSHIGVGTTNGGGYLKKKYLMPIKI